jgi:hypothetical protein
MALSTPDEKRWVIDGMDREAIQLGKEMAARHGVRMARIIEEALFHYDQVLGRDVELPAGWRKPRDW